MSLINNLNNLHHKIAKFIKNYTIKNNGFKSRSFYGETFSLNLLEMNSILDQKIRDILIEQYENIDKSHHDFHWEFNNYALLQYQIYSNDYIVNKFLEPLKFKGTPVTNWTLLRSNARFLANRDTELAIKEAKEKIEKFQLDSGLILDKKDDKSFQYHCFSMAMIGELYEKTQDEYFLNSFQQGVAFIRNFILSNGETLYIGRGQNQSFGYGALIYMLTLAYKLFNDKTLLGDIELVYSFLVQFQKEDGSFPLVMNGVEKNIPMVINPKDTNYPGWYPYNNYFDYLPFMGYFIAKATSVLKELDVSNIVYKKHGSYHDKNFIKVVHNKYEAVVSRSGGYWTNDMTIPYIIYKGDTMMPMYGGEQFQKSFYSLEGLALPWCRLVKTSFRKYFISWFRENTLYMLSVLGFLKREYIFKEDEIIIKSYMLSPFFCKHNYLFKNGIEQVNSKTLKYKDIEIISDKDMSFHSFEYSASGLLKSFRAKSPKHKITIRLK